MGKMASETPKITTPFLDDYVHFESIHAKFPCEATAVFERVDGLRLALQVFRESTNTILVGASLCGEKITPVAEEALLDGSSALEMLALDDSFALEMLSLDGSPAALVSPSTDSTEEEMGQIDAACVLVAPVAG